MLRVREWVEGGERGRMWGWVCKGWRRVFGGVESLSKAEMNSACIYVFMIHFRLSFCLCVIFSSFFLSEWWSTQKKPQTSFCLLKTKILKTMEETRYEHSNSAQKEVLPRRQTLPRVDRIKTNRRFDSRPTRDSWISNDSGISVGSNHSPSDTNNEGKEQQRTISTTS